MTDQLAYLGSYDGPDITLMEVCGTHTTEIAHCGLPSLLSPRIHLISGPGCPVCVTVTAYIDRLIELCRTPNTCVVTFGDMLRVPGSSVSLADARATGGRVETVYAPSQMLALAKSAPTTDFVFAAVGFETTAAVYATLMERIVREKIQNVRFLTSLKTMPQAIEYVLSGPDLAIDGLLAPGHVSVITGSRIYEAPSAAHQIPVCVAGFTPDLLIGAVYSLVRLVEAGKPRVLNLYPSAVTRDGNESALRTIDRFFAPVDAAWRGLGRLPGSGLGLRDEYLAWDAGSTGLLEDKEANPGCRCAEILRGGVRPVECPLFGTVCTPTRPAGACMVSTEGSCRNAYQYREDCR